MGLKSCGFQKPHKCMINLSSTFQASISVLSWVRISLISCMIIGNATMHANNAKAPRPVAQYAAARIILQLKYIVLSCKTR